MAILIAPTCEDCGSTVVAQYQCPKCFWTTEPPTEPGWYPVATGPPCDEMLVVYAGHDPDDAVFSLRYGHDWYFLDHFTFWGPKLDLPDPPTGPNSED